MITGQDLGSASDNTLTHLSQIESRVDLLEKAVKERPPLDTATDLLELGEEVLIIWSLGKGSQPTTETKEGFRLLALHRQGAKGDPSFNACRETTREIAYHYNCVLSDPEHRNVARQLIAMAACVRHLCLFVSGKMQVEGLGEFCCSAKPLREQG